MESNRRVKIWHRDYRCFTTKSLATILYFSSLLTAYGKNFRNWALLRRNYALSQIPEWMYGAQVAELLEGKCRKIVKYAFSAGEENKNLETVKDVYRYLIEEGFDRKDMLLALGGGVTGDLTGFVAATYLRGIDFVQIPTTLLAQVDSSIGGKTGVDFDSYKNMVGAFKMPRLVYMNLSVLKTLEERQFYSGFAEVMKSALIKDALFYEWLIENMYETCHFGRDGDPYLFH